MDTFLLCLGATFIFFISAMAAALALKLGGTTVNTAQAKLLLNYAYWTTYPTGLAALVALFWHWIRFYRGDYVRV